MRISRDAARAVRPVGNKQKARIAEAEGQEHEEIGEGGRLYNDADVEEYEKADTDLD